MGNKEPIILATSAIPPGVQVPALVQRINRALRKRGEKLRKYRGGRSWLTLGDYYIVDVRRNFVVASHIDVEELGGELGVFEELENVTGD